MAPWLRLLEGWAVEQLLRTPGFHRAVEKVAKNVHRVRNGLPREEAGGTSIDRGDGPGFGQHFYDELKSQLGRAERSEHTSTVLQDEGKRYDRSPLNKSRPGSEKEEAEGSDAAWYELQRRSAGSRSEAAAEEAQDSDAAWKDIQRRSAEPPKQGFMNEYMDALRSQLRNEKPGK